MARKNSVKLIMSLVAPLLIFTACTSPVEPAPAPTVVVTEVVEVTKIEVLPSEVVVEKILVAEPDVDTGEIEVLVQGHASNTCTTVKGVSISRDGDVFNLNLETTVSDDETCQDEAVPFEETATVDIGELTPGTYLFASGAIASYTLEGQPEEPTEEISAGEGGETGTEAETPTEGETGESPPEGVEGEPRDCEDLAAFVADVTYPDNTVVQAGESITKTWAISNQGTCNWGSGYELKFSSGSFTEVASLSDPFPVAEPSESVQVSVVLTTPLSAGTHSGVWVIERPEGDNIEVQAGKAFDLWAIVRVTTMTTGAGTPGDTRTRKDGMVCAQENAGYEEQLLQLINNARAKNNLPAYEAQSQLAEAARVLTEDMACNDFVSHTGTDGSDWFDRITAQGYNYRDAAENIVFGYGTVPELAFNWWMDSSIHRGNILSLDLTQIGIAYALNPQTGGSYYTLVFAAPED